MNWASGLWEFIWRDLILALLWEHIGLVLFIACALGVLGWMFITTMRNRKAS